MGGVSAGRQELAAVAARPQLRCLPVVSKSGLSTANQEDSSATSLSLGQTGCTGASRSSECTRGCAAVTPAPRQPLLDLYYTGLKINNLKKAKEKN